MLIARIKVKDKGKRPAYTSVIASKMTEKMMRRTLENTINGEGKIISLEWLQVEWHKLTPRAKLPLEKLRRHVDENGKNTHILKNKYISNLLKRGVLKAFKVI